MVNTVGEQPDIEGNKVPVPPFHNVLFYGEQPDIEGNKFIIAFSSFHNIQYGEQPDIEGNKLLERQIRLHQRWNGRTARYRGQ